MTISNNILKQSIISAEKVMNIKVLELIKIYNFYFGHLSIRQSGSMHCSQIYLFTIREICKICEQCYYHCIWWRNDYNKSYRSWWVLQLLCWWFFQLKSFTLLKCRFKLTFFEIQILSHKIESYEKMTKMKVVVLEKL